MKKHLSRIMLLILLILLLAWSTSIVKCELITMCHGDEFLSFKEVNTASKFKILTYSSDFARIYCVNYNKSNGSVYNFVKKDGVWIYNQWEDIGWSKYGTADGFIWPYIR